MDCVSTVVIDTSIVVILVILLGLAIMTYMVARQPHFSGQGFCIGTHVAMLGWLASAILEMSATNEHCKIAFALLAWPSIAALPTVWAFFLHAYAFGRDKKLARWEWAALVGGPFIVAIMAFSNPWHELLYGPETTMLEIDGRLSVQYQHGPLFYVAAGYLYLFLIAAIGVGISGMWLANRAYRGHFAVLIAITAFPIAGNLAYIFGGVTILGFDPTPFMFALVLFLFTWMMTVTRPFDLSTIGRDLLFFTTRDPTIMIDIDGCVMTTNTAARMVFAKANIHLARGKPLPAQSPVTPLLRSAVGNKAPPQPTRLTILDRTYVAQILAVNRPLARKTQLMGWLISLTDISNVLTLQDELQGERDFLARVLETDLSGMLAFGYDGRIVFANAEAERLLGVEPGGCISRRYDEPSWGIRALDGSDIRPQDLPIAQILDSEMSLRDVRLSILRPDGERRAISLNATPLRIAGNPARAVCSIVDITDQLATEAALRDAVIHAEAANAAKSVFLANMSHEIRTPLTGVLGMADLLAETELTPEQKPMVETIRNSGWGLLSLINDILDLARVEAGKLTLDPRPFRLNTLMQQLESLHIASAHAKGIEFGVTCQGEGGMQRMGDITRVMQIMQNLIGNALKFTEEGRVTVQFDATNPEFVDFIVSDTGIGMTQEQSIRVFDEFEQAESGTARRFGGTGLGLSIVRRLVDMMHGTITVKTAPGEGTEIAFRLKLPVLQGISAEDFVPAQSGGETEFDTDKLIGCKVLVADDTPTNRMVMQIMLKQLGVEAFLAENGLQACKLWQEQEFDLIILDISMPVMDGMEALNTILREAEETGRAKPRAIAATANVMKEQTASYLAAGFIDILPKPINKQKLARALSNALN
ncbi:histidine kinase N-terminal 7TM domain-containing protein [Roseinatronobacter sp. S2]|uniref:histidine kinase N-terminal 7TM domain-containing protein n=1 Tax=Roseinatronobacter sp. S2 TaxID=3035471 RepID=UPI0024109012|nr:histidine kinase N-terminal 7TM domain-containing protein [Roseinatronobacter sp. S2]WFE75443.1 histidine kinase N-terminal 7TM domain-containing protein [Roseinatronobacter sp. S2]